MQPQDNPVRKLYEDACYVVFDKPAGLLVIPTPKKETHTLIHLVNERQASGEGTQRLYPCHRLDRETSGAILFAKGKRHQKLMMEAFRRRAVIKKYIAFIHGRLHPAKGELRSAVQDLEERKFRRHPQKKYAVTRYRVMRQMQAFSVVELQPVTGRTNQIRIQFSQIGHPLVGERKYAVAKNYPLKFRRTALHAHCLQWRHPVTHQWVSVTSPLAEDMEVFLARNGN